MRRHQLVIFAVLLLAAWAAVAYETPRRTVTENRMGLLFTPATETVEVVKGLQVESPTVPAQLVACTARNLQQCDAACGGYATSCTRDETWVFMGCLPMCQWAVHVTVRCGC